MHYEITSFVLGLLNSALLLLVSPFFDGYCRKIAARLQSRIGPPVTQGYRDVSKLLSRRIDVIPSTSKGFFSHYPVIYLAVLLSTSVLLPSFTGLAFPYSDFITVIYMIAIAEFIGVLASFDTSNPFAVIGSARKIPLILLAEVSLAGAVFSQIINPAVATTSISEAVSRIGGNWRVILSTPSYYIAFAAAILALLGDSEVLPYDVDEAEQEILGGLTLEYSGRSLGFVRLAQMLRRVLLATLVIDFFAPWPVASATSVLMTVVSAVMYTFKLLVLFGLVSILAQCFARFRVFDATRSLFTAFTLSILSIILSSMGV